MDKEALKRKRTTLRTSTTRILTKIETIFNEDPQMSPEEKTEQLGILLEQLNEKYLGLKETNSDLEKVLKLEEIEAEIEGNENYNEKIIEYKFRVSKYLNESKRVNANSNANEHPSNTRNMSSEQNVAASNLVCQKLPKLQIKPYFGDCSKFLEFWAQFENAIHGNESLTDLDKFTFLKSLVGGSAANAIAGFALTSANYNSAVELLKNRYGRTDLVINAHMNKLLNMIPVKNSSNLKALRELYDSCEIQIRNLNTLGVTTGSYGNLLCPILLKLIPNDIALEFNRKRTEKADWNIDELMTFIRGELSSREATLNINYGDKLSYEKEKGIFEKNTYSKFDRNKVQNSKRNISSATALSTYVKGSCIFCAKSHDSKNCGVLTIPQKREKLKKDNRCFCCFRKWHVSAACRVAENCAFCDSRFHDKSVCTAKQRTAPPLAQEIQKKNDENEASITTVSQCNVKRSQNNNNTEAVLQTCPVKVISGNKSHIATIIFDSAAERTFCTQKLVNILNPPVIRQEKIIIYSFGSLKSQELTLNVVLLKLQNIEDPQKYVFVECLVKQNLMATCVKTPKFNPETCSKLSNYRLMNFPTRQDDSISILLGMDCLGKVMNNAEFHNISNSLFIFSSLFGNILCGAYQLNDQGEKSYDRSGNVLLSPTQSVTNSRNKRCSERKENFVLSVFSENSEQFDLKNLFSLEVIGLQDNDNNESSELNCQIMQSFQDSLQYDGKRYTTKLLWKSGDKTNLGVNFLVAKGRFGELGRRLKHNPDVLEKYKSVVSQQLKDGIVEECKNFRIDTGYFLPHMPILRADKVSFSVRPVFDASSKEGEFWSLNDFLYSGPNLTADILDVILNFRKYNIAFCGDIQQAFLQIRVFENERDFLKFIWFHDTDENSFKVLRFTSLAFGLSCSPFLLGAVIKFHIKKYEDIHNDVVKMLDSSLYVDDLMYGADTVSEAFYLSTTAKKILADASMNLRKFHTNSESLRGMWKEKNLCSDDETSSSILKVLGLFWDTENDVLKLDVQPLIESLGEMLPTKRSVLKIMLKVYDVVGYVLPFILRVKILLQETWEQGLAWDDELPMELKEKWDVWCSEATQLKQFEVSRKYFNHGINFKSDNVQIHIFSDASPKAYGAVAYFRCVNKDNEISTSFIWAKSRVAPIKRVTIPRLELIGAVIACRMAKYLKTIFKVPNLEIKFWTDSKVALSWLKGSASNWKPFVCNRVVEIQNLSDPEDWNFCKGSQNPADLLTRGEKLSSLLENELWWKGPPWLGYLENMWPQKITSETNDNVLVEKRSVKVMYCDVNRVAEGIFDVSKYSRLNRVLRVTAWILRFAYNLKHPNERESGPLKASEIDKAERYWIGVVQDNAFKTEIEQLKNNSTLSKDSNLINLGPQLDKNGLITLKSRLEHSQFSETEKHPWVLPHNYNFVKLLIMNAHYDVLHFGVATTLAHLREKFYIIKGRKAVKSILRKCIICCKYNASAGCEVIAPLPKERIIESPPFENCGLDFAGPIYIKTVLGSEKAYILIITCAVTRALHLELVSNLSTNNFILAFRRFTARRGLCKHVYSDNSKTFLKANSFLAEIWKNISQQEFFNHLSKNRISWKYIVPRASWWGGFYERLVRTVKTPLKKILGKTCLTYEEMETTLAEVEAMVNSRPLTYTYAEHSEPVPLTPAHLLVGKRLTTMPDGVPLIVGNESTKLTLMKQYKYRQQALQHFWRRWRQEYLLELRTANLISSPNTSSEFKIDELVLIHQDKLPKHMWSAGRITELFRGRDGKIRACAVQTAKGVLRRPIQLLFRPELDMCT